MIKSLRFKHYSYLALAVLLVITSIFNIVFNLRSAQAELGTVSITSPSENEEINQKTRQITGTAPALKEVAVFDGSKKVGTTTSSAGGTWSLEWLDPSPGQHSLKASVVDGTYFRTDPLSASSIKAHNLNSGQVSQSYDAGFSGSAGMFYDDALQRAYTINYLSGTISEVNTTSNEVEATFAYNANPAGNGLFGAAYVSAPKYRTFCSVTENSVTLCAYNYNQANHTLYILDFNKLYVVNTQSKSVVATIDVGDPDNESEYNNVDLNYKLYRDPQNAYLYVYHEKSDAYNTNKITRINLQSNTVDSAWNYSGNAIVSDANGNVYFAKTQTADGVFVQNLYVLPQGSQTIEQIIIAGDDCEQHASQLALSKDDTTLYAACTSASGVKKLVAYNLNNAQTVVAVDRTGDFLSTGNLYSKKLLIKTSAGTSLDSFNTQTNALDPSIQPLVGVLQERSLVINDTDEKAYFFTTDTSGAQNHFYEVDLQSGGILNDRTYQTNEFNGARAAAQTTYGQYIFLATLPTEGFNSINISNGTRTMIKSGIGPAGGIAYDKTHGKLFSYSLNSKFGYSNRISVSDALTGEYQADITLPDTYYVAQGIMSTDDSSLYVIATDFSLYGSSGVLQVFKIDAQTLAITRIYESLNQYAPDSTDTPIGKLAVGGNTLAFTVGYKLFALDIQNDTVSQKDWFPVTGEPGDVLFTPAAMHSQQLVSVSEDGATIVALKSPQNLGLLHLDLEEFIPPGVTPEIGSEFANKFFFTNNRGLTSIQFAPNGHLIGGSVGLSSSQFVSQPPEISNINLSDLSYETASVAATQGAYSVCAINQITTSPSTSYIFFQTGCATPVDNNSTARITLYASVFNMDTNTNLLTKPIAAVASANFYDYTANLPSAQADFTVLQATRQVVVRADAVSITSPSQGAQSNPGKTTIVGTAPPNAPVVVKVDGSSIGTVSANEYGGWTLDHVFTAKKVYAITAEYIRPEKTVMYQPQNAFSGSGLDAANSSINIIDVATNNVINQIKLPSGYVSFNVTTSPNGQSVYIVGIKPVSGNMASDLRLFTYNAATLQLQSTTDLAGTASSLAAGGSYISEDASTVYTAQPVGQQGSSLDITIKDFAIDGSLRHTYPVTIDAADLENTVLFKFIEAKAENRLYVLLGSHKVLVINTLTAEVSQAVVPDGLSIQSMEYVSGRGLLYTIFNSATETKVTAVNPADQAGQPVWEKTTQNQLALKGSIISKDKTKLMFIAKKSTNQGSAYVIHSYDTADGTLSVSEVSQDLDVVGALDSLLLRLSYSVDESGALLYASNIQYAVGAQAAAASAVRYDVGALTSRPIYGVKSDFISFYVNYLNNSVAQIPGETLMADRSFSVVGIGIPPIEPPIVVPPAVVNPPAPVSPPNQVVSEAKTSFRKNAQAVALSPSLGTRFAGKAKVLFARLPWRVVKSVPYVMYLALMVLAGYYLFQTQKQLRREDRIRAILHKQKVLTEEKRNFLELTSHYLRTPLTYIRSGAEMAGRKGGQSEQLAADMSEAVNHLSLFVESLIEESSASVNKVISEPVKIESPLLSRTFLLPALGLTASIGLFYFLTTGVIGIKIQSATYFTHIVLTFLVIRLFYGMIKNNRLAAAENKQIDAVLVAEKALDHSRSKLLQDAGEQLKTRTDHIAGLSTQITNDDTGKRIIQQGVERLQELARAFSLVCKLEVQSLVTNMQPVTAKTFAAEVIEPFRQELLDKKLNLTIVGFKESVHLTTNKPLAELTLKSLIQNAIQASKEGDNLIVKCLSSDGHVAFQVIDHGEGIPKEKISQLFKPFVRVGPVTTFNREGIGLSLFLDRLIMHSLGGEVEIMSKFEQGTVATLTFKQKPTT